MRCNHKSYNIRGLDLDQLLYSLQILREIHGITRIESNSIGKHSLKIPRSLCALSTLLAMHHNVGLIVSVCSMHCTESMQQYDLHFDLSGSQSRIIDCFISYNCFEFSDVIK